MSTQTQEKVCSKSIESMQLVRTNPPIQMPPPILPHSTSSDEFTGSSGQTCRTGAPHIAALVAILDTHYSPVVLY